MTLFSRKSKALCAHPDYHRVATSRPQGDALPDRQLRTDGPLRHGPGSYHMWGCQVATSRVHRNLLLVVAVCSAIAIAISPLALPVQLGCAVLLIYFLVLRWRTSNAGYTLLHDGGIENTTNQWILYAGSNRSTNAQLLHQGYFSAGLLVLVFQPDDGSAIVRLPIWYDSVDAAAYSYLVMQLRFNAFKPGISREST